MKLLKLTIAVALISILNLEQVSGETLSVIAPNDSYYPGATNITVNISLDDVTTNGIAGASFKVTYDTSKLALTGVTSNFFDTIASTTIPPDPTTYTKALVWNTDGISGGALIAGARATKGTTNPSTILTLKFSVAATAPSGIYEISVAESRIINPAAGYDVETELPVLVGINDSDPNNIVYTALYLADIDVIPDTITVYYGDTDNDGIPDQWERDNVPDGIDPKSTEALDVFGSGDYDKDGYSDKQEFINGTDPTEMDAPNGPGYDSSTDIRVSIEDFPWILFLPVISK